ncbi:glutaminyl-peptide cyclotransferase [Marinimicrobium sp. ABcell2]|uniref:glutaminyl-peptide cyclotransferase n=1 Tax=Marinimicrobium sp. ABcell2 TaxID=3069751 RepID=UPI0027B47D76|nr:glutaminyl-peptide cyclotransferase [Marinimicrobium sp. ABcell2]MDQ2075211.1 glutaminyl-peptide cyclotransferase [Marinimicrobium sp. ABcell2]
MATASSRPSLPLAGTFLLCLAGIISACQASIDAPTEYTYTVLEERDHSTRLFTQGLLLHDGLFYESSGGYGRSRLVSYPRSGPAEGFVNHKSLPRRYFAEGLTEMEGKLYLLTWRENTLFVLDRDSFEELTSHKYTGEGWGLTDNGDVLIRSDGSHRLFFHDREDFSLLRTLEVHKKGTPVRKLNELEYIDGFVWSNIWHDNRLVQIDLETGHVVGYVDLTDLAEQTAPAHRESVLNGIAWDEEHQAMWVTGKNWPTLFLIRLNQLQEANREG